MKMYRTPIAAALCCMALASGSVLAQSDTSRSSGSAASSTSRSDMGSSASMDRETVRQVQQALQSKGHNPGPIDGVMGPRTRSALQAYQRANNLTGAKGLDQQTMSSLGVQASAGSSAGGSGSMAGGSTSGSSAGGSGSSAGGSGSTSGGTGGSMSRPDTGSGTTGGTTGSRSGASDGSSSGSTGSSTGGSSSGGAK